jgi:1,4-dihydroxy-2-naphthoyl-CoA hydrolase
MGGPWESGGQRGRSPLFLTTRNVVDAGEAGVVTCRPLMPVYRQENLMPEFKLSPGIAPLPFAHLLEIEIVEAAKEGIRGKVKVRPEMCTAGHILHGGAIMSFADTLGAFGATLNLPEGANGTTTLESKTNFLGSAKEGETVLGHSTPVHIGRRTSVWQTKITTESGRNVALVTQTQMVL